MKNKIILILATLLASLFVFTSCVYADEVTFKNVHFAKDKVQQRELGIIIYADLEGQLNLTDKQTLYFDFREESFDLNGMCFSIPVFKQSDSVWYSYSSFEDIRAGYIYNLYGITISTEVEGEELLQNAPVNFTMSENKNDYTSLSITLSDYTNNLSFDGGKTTYGKYDMLYIKTDSTLIRDHMNEINDSSFAALIEGKENGFSQMIYGKLVNTDDEGFYYIGFDLSDFQLRAPKMEAGSYKISSLSINNNVLSFDWGNYMGYDEYGKIKYHVEMFDKDMSFEIVESAASEESNTSVTVVDIYSTEGNINNQVVDIYSNSGKSDILSSFSLAKASAKINDKVYINYETSKKISNIILNFVDSASGETLVTTVRDLDSKPYFVVPYTTMPGSYTLTYAIFTDRDGNEYHYRNEPTLGKIMYYDFNSVLNVEQASAEVDSNYLDIDNSKVTIEVITKIKDSAENVTITLNADEEAVIKAEVFEAIKGQNKLLVVNYGADQWIFNGKDIKETKDIDVSMNKLQSNSVETDKDLANMLGKALILNYADNGVLPGKALIRIKATESVKTYLNNDKIYVYFYNDDDKKLEKVAFLLTMTTDGYYEFYINHNSSYVITTEEVEEKYVSESTELLDMQKDLKPGKTIASSESSATSFTKEQLIIAVLVIAIMILLIIIVLSRKNKKSSKVNETNETKNEENNDSKE